MNLKEFKALRTLFQVIRDTSSEPLIAKHAEMGLKILNDAKKAEGKRELEILKPK